jgi:glucans biosynthesis protein
MAGQEEFPRFSNFWIERLDGEDGMMIYALLDSPSVAGAYRIRASRRTIVGRARWRAIFDFKPDAETADLRAFLDLNGRALTETWLYQHAERPRSG